MSDAPTSLEIALAALAEIEAMAHGEFPRPESYAYAVGYIGGIAREALAAADPEREAGFKEFRG